MNVPLRRVAVVMLALFLVLMGATTWIQVVAAPSLNADSRNTQRAIQRELSIERGSILVNGKAIAESVPATDRDGFQRTYSQPELYAAVTGYYSVYLRSTGLERYANEYLAGTSDTLWWSRFQNVISGQTAQGFSVDLTLDPAVQQAAWDALGDQVGSVVAMDPKTGAILAMVSKPSYDPNTLAGTSYSEATTVFKTLEADPAKPMVNRAIAGNTYPPGSTFKLVTAAAALEQGTLTPDSLVAAPDTLALPGSTRTMNNFGNSACTSSADKTMTLAAALAISCNTAFGQLGIDLGAASIADQAKAFGFGEDIAIPLPVTPSVFPQGANGKPLDDSLTAMSAIGQYEVKVTPLEVAMVTAGIANDGKVMTPYLVQQVRAPDLSVLKQTKPEVLNTAVSPETAHALRDMMIGVVQDGSGTSAQIPGVQVAGKSGTAQTTAEAAPHAWFTAFAPANNPQVVVVVILENGGDAGSEATGGRNAAPVAKAVIEAVISK